MSSSPEGGVEADEPDQPLKAGLVSGVAMATNFRFYWASRGGRHVVRGHFGDNRIVTKNIADRRE